MLTQDPSVDLELSVLSSDARADCFLRGNLPDVSVIEEEPVVVVEPILYAWLDVGVVVALVECARMDQDRVQVIPIDHGYLPLICRRRPPIRSF